MPACARALCRGLPGWCLTDTIECIFIASCVWDAGPLEEQLARQADRMVRGPDAVPVIDDSAFSKKGRHSVRVAPQYASALGKNANCQTLVSLTAP